MAKINKYLTYVALGLVVLSVLPFSSASAQEPVPSLYMEPMLVDEKLASDIVYPEGFTKIKIDPGYSHLQLEPGESEKITVTVTNREDEAITSSPDIVMSPYSENFFEEEWLTITPETADIKPGSSQEFVIEIDIPEDADLGYYSGYVAFIAMEDDVEQAYPENFNTMQLSVEVWVPPIIQIQNSYISDRVEAGGEYDYEIKLINTGDRDVAIDPEIVENDMVMYELRYSYMPQGFGDDAITVDAPSEVKAGGTAVVNVHLEVPQDAKGTYSGSIDLNIDDPGIREWEDQIHMNFDVWTPPTEPYIKKFISRTNAPINIKVSTIQYDYGRWMGAGSASDEVPSFEVTLENESDKVEVELVSTSYTGSVNLGISSLPPWEMESSGIYQESFSGYEEVYSAPGAVGEWTLGILPVNTESFEYEINIGSSQ